MRQFCNHRNGIGIPKGCIVLIGVGANLPGPGDRAPLDTCRLAVAMLDSFPDMRLVSLSRWFETAPVPPSGQPAYVNAVAALLVDPGVTIDPALLLSRLMELEAAFGRERSAPNAARTLDLDIIAIGDLVREAPDPILPHPRAHLRAFVLVPLADVAPDWIHPVLFRSVSELISALPAQENRAL